MYFYRGVACEYFGVYWTRSRVVHMVGFWGGPKFEANVRRLNTSATGLHATKYTYQKADYQTIEASFSLSLSPSLSLSLSLPSLSLSLSPSLNLLTM